MKALGITFILLVVAAGAAIFLFAPPGLVGSLNLGSTASPQGPQTSVTYRVILDGQSSNINDRINYVIHSATELSQLWTLIGTESNLPNIDFSQEEVVAVFAGQEPTAGYSINVASVADTATSRMVNVSINKPGGSCVEAQQLTTPFEIIAFPKTTLSLTHTDTVKTLSCVEQ